MDFLSDMIEKKVMKFDSDSFNNQESLWDFYQAVNLAGILKKKDIIIRNKLWRETLLKNQRSKEILNIISSKDREKLYKFLISKAETEEEKTRIGNLWKKGRIAVSEFEYG